MRYLAIVAALALGAAAPALAAPFTLAVLPDTQIYTFLTAANPNRPALFEVQTQWLVDNAAAKNIKFVTQVGDIVDNVTPGQIAAANKAFNILDGKLAYSVLPGNHDYNVVGRKQPGDLSVYEANFARSRFDGYTWDRTSTPTATNYFGGFMPNDFGGVVSDLNIGNSWQVFDGGGRRFLHLSLEWQPDYSGIGAVLTGRKVLEWANSIVDAFPGMPTIITTHEDLRDADPSGANGGTTLFGTHIFNNLVRQNDQIFMVLSGHNHFGENQTNRDGEWRLVSKNDAGNDVFRIMTTFQDWPDGGGGYLRLMAIDPTQGTIDVETFSPFTGLFLKDFIGPTASQFSYELDFDARFGPAALPAPGAWLLALPLIALARRFRRA